MERIIRNRNRGKKFKEKSESIDFLSKTLGSIKVGVKTQVLETQYSNTCGLKNG